MLTPGHSTAGGRGVSVRAEAKTPAYFLTTLT
jgi:hypothetical protein